MQVRTLPDVQVLSDFGAYGVSLPPGHRLEVQVQVTPCSYGIICTLLVLDFGEWVGWCWVGGWTAFSTRLALHIERAGCHTQQG